MLPSIALALLCATLVSSQHNLNNVPGRNSIVHLFEWKWNDIADECERFLAPKGFAGVQVSPVSENVVAWHPDFNTAVERPWYERYQPVSYKLITRSGDEAQFRDMVSRCNAVGVRIYVDIVLNHMTGYWPSGTAATAGSSFDAGSLDYSAVPYSASDFHGSGDCPTASGDIENYDDGIQVRNCKLGGLNDLNQSSEYVRGKIRDFLNTLIGIGVAGFRVDVAKHILSSDLEAILNSLDDLPTSHGFAAGSRAFVVHEVSDVGGESIPISEYFNIGYITEFRYSRDIGTAFRGNNQLKSLVNFGEEWGFVPREYALVFIDNHDNQRGSGFGGDQILTFRNARQYKMATAFMLAWPYGVTRIMSSFYWEQNWVNGVDYNSWVGPPHDADFNTLSVTINADNTCENGWVCEHRWQEIYNMVEFKNVVEGEGVNDWWDNGNNQIAFCRGGKGFIAINGETGGLAERLQTRLPSGIYCDVITGSLINGDCTGHRITVGSDGKANIDLRGDAFDGVFATHINAKLL